MISLLIMKLFLEVFKSNIIENMIAKHKFGRKTKQYLLFDEKQSCCRKVQLKLSLTR